MLTVLTEGINCVECLLADLSSVPVQSVEQRWEDLRVVVGDLGEEVLSAVTGREPCCLLDNVLRVVKRRNDIRDYLCKSLFHRLSAAFGHNPHGKDTCFSVEPVGMVTILADGCHQWSEDYLVG